MVVVVVVINSVVVVDVVVVVGGATSENKLNSVFRRFSLPAAAAGFEPSMVGLRRRAFYHCAIGSQPSRIVLKLPKFS
jgi:hypothetical protein